MATPHIAANPGDFAPAVLMPGDPKRAARMAESILSDAKLVTDTRGMLGFTGTYKGDGPNQGQPLSIMASGMGVASVGLYCTELFKYYDVQRIVRVGTCGALHPWLEIGTVIIVTGAHCATSINEARIPGIHFAAVPDLPMAAAALAAAQATPDRKILSGTICTSDHFYFAVPNQAGGLAKHGALAFDMETAGLYGVAAEFGKQALSIVTVADNLVKQVQDLSADDREQKFQTALDLALAGIFA